MTILTELRQSVNSVIAKRRDAKGKYLSAQDVESLTLLTNTLEMCDWYNAATQECLLLTVRHNLNQQIQEYALQWNHGTSFTIFENRGGRYYLVGVAAATALMRNSESHPYQLLPDNDHLSSRMVTLPTFLRILNVVPGRTIDAAIQTPGTLWSFYGPAIGE